MGQHVVLVYNFSSNSPGNYLGTGEGYILKLRLESDTGLIGVHAAF
jgi:hypothetical protein